MFKHLSVLPVIATLLLASACGEDISRSTERLSSAGTASSEDKDRDGSSASGSTSKIPTTGEFEIVLSDVVTQAAPWGDVEISVAKARLLRGDKPSGFPSDVKHSSKTVYAVVDLKIEAKGSTDTDYRDRDTWDLVLGNDQRVTPLNPVGKLLQPGDETTASLFYEVSTDANLSGAALEINGSDRNVLEPLRIPLNVKQVFESRVELSDLVGDSFESEDGGVWSLEIVNASFGVNLPDSGRRAPRDKRFVELTVQVEHEGTSSRSFDVGDAPRLSIGERAFAPEDFTAKTIDGGESARFVMIYAIDEDASDFDLVVDLGEDELRTKSVSLPSLLEDEFEPADDDADDSFSEDSDEEDSDEEDSDEEDSDEEDSDEGDACGCSSGDDVESGDAFDSDEDFETDDEDFETDDEDFETDDEDFETDDEDFETDDEDEDSEEQPRN